MGRRPMGHSLWSRLGKWRGLLTDSCGNGGGPACDAGSTVTCKKCRLRMKELKGHIYHKQRKWKCPKCSRVRMQAQKA